MLLDALSASVWAVVVVVILVVLVWYSTPRRADNMPPGPRPWPLIGNLTSFADKDPIKHWESKKHKEKYGDVYSLYAMNQQLIILHSYEAIREAFVKHGDVLSARPKSPIVEEFTKHYKGLIQISGDFWKEQRKFALITLRDFGFGKASLEDKILEEIGVYLQKLDESHGQPVDIQYLTQTSVSNIICSIVFGRRFQHDDPKFISYLNALRENSIWTSSPALLILDKFPWLKYLPGDLLRYWRTSGNVHHIFRFINEIICEHASSLNPENPRDFIDAFMLKMREESANSNSTFEEDQLTMAVFDLFFGGTETTSTTLLWMVLYMCQNPDIQTQIQAELDQVIGNDRNPVCQDRQNLPFTDACINETQRFADILPVGAAHAASEDCYLKGYFIPKGSVILSFLRGVHHDKDYWGDPEIFRPSRFLDDNGQVKKFDYLIPFSLGRRHCLGESLAKMELFLFVASMLKNFNFSFRKDIPPPEGKGIFGITVSPEPYEVCCNRRKV